MLNERMQKPLQGNLALSFLFKDQDLSDIIKMRGNGGDETVGRLTTAVGDRMSTMVPEESKDVHRMSVVPQS